MDLSLPFPRRSVDGKDGRPIGTIERTAQGVFVSHAVAGDLPPFDDIAPAVARLLSVHDAVAAREKARDYYDQVYSRHERAMVLGLPSLPPLVLKNAYRDLERAEEAIAELMGSASHD